MVRLSGANVNAYTLNSRTKRIAIDLTNGANGAMASVTLKETPMAKARSPSYPAISLKEALDKISEIYERDYQNPIPKAVAAAHMGYGGLNGKSLGVLAALSKFGLLEGRGNESKVSDLAVKIIVHPHGTPERAEGIKVAAEKPELFNELDNRFQGGKASDQAIRSYLLTQKFIPAGADALIRSYRETKQLVAAESGGYSSESSPRDPEAPVQAAQAQAPSAKAPPPAALTAEEPFRVSFSPGGIDVTARIIDLASADELIRSINALKLLLRPSSDFKKPADDPDFLK